MYKNFSLLLCLFTLSLLEGAETQTNSTPIKNSPKLTTRKPSPKKKSVPQRQFLNLLRNLIFESSSRTKAGVGVAAGLTTVVVYTFSLTPQIQLQGEEWKVDGGNMHYGNVTGIQKYENYLVVTGDGDRDELNESIKIFKFKNGMENVKIKRKNKHDPKKNPDKMRAHTLAFLPPGFIKNQKIEGTKQVNGQEFKEKLAFFVIGSKEGNPTLWSINDRRFTGNVGGYVFKSVPFVAASTQRNHIATADSRGNIQVFSLERKKNKKNYITKKTTPHYESHSVGKKLKISGSPGGLLFSPTGTLVSFAKSYIKCWDYKEEAQKKVPAEKEKLLSTPAKEPKGGYEKTFVLRNRLDIKALTFSPSGKEMVYASADGKLLLINMDVEPNKRGRVVFDGGIDNVSAIHFLSEDIFVIGAENRIVYFFYVDRSAKKPKIRRIKLDWDMKNKIKTFFYDGKEKGLYVGTRGGKLAHCTVDPKLLVEAIQKDKRLLA